MTPDQTPTVRRPLTHKHKLRLELLEDRRNPVAFTEFVDPHPASGNQFGAEVLSLSNGNVVITSPFDDAAGVDAGAVYLFNGATGAMISALTGSSAGDQVGANYGARPLTNGNFIVLSPKWDNGAAADAGAVTLVDASTGLNGAVGVGNSLVGSTANDQVGNGYLTPLTTGNFILQSLNWDNGAATDAGAVTFINGTTGLTGAVSSANSLVGGKSGDQVGDGYVRTLPNGNYLVVSENWDNGAVVNAGAITFGNGTTGVSGPVNAANSLVGTAAYDLFGMSMYTLATGNYVMTFNNWDNGAAANAGAVTFGNGTTGVSGAITSSNSLVGVKTGDFQNPIVTPLTNGNYVVSDHDWDNGSTVDVGAVTLASGVTGLSGTVSAANSLIGTNANDAVGYGRVTALPNGNYVVSSPHWKNGAAADAGAVTLVNGTTGLIGAVSAANSLVGTQTTDLVGIGGVTELANNNFVVNSYYWNNGGVAQAGAVTFGNGVTGLVGAVSSANSLVGSKTGDVGLTTGSVPVVPLKNGNYVVVSGYWDNGAAANAGAVTFGDGTTGVSGTISSANSLVGTSSGDSLGYRGVTPLDSGDYVVNSPYWNNGAVSTAGAVTFGNGTTGVNGPVSAANSLVGTTAYDLVGEYGSEKLDGGRYQVRAPSWHNGSAANAGAITLSLGAGGVSGPVSAANSLVGTTANDQVGLYGTVTLANGNYVVISPNWANGAAAKAGAVTFVDKAVGIAGTVTPANSLVGTRANDQVGSGFVLPLGTGNYVVTSPLWDNGALANAGAVTFGSGTAGVNGPVTVANSVFGATANAGLLYTAADDVNGTLLSVFSTEGNGKIRVGSQTTGFNTAPVLSLSSGSAVFTEGDAAAPVDAAATVADTQQNWGGGSVSAQITANATGDDRLAILPGGVIAVSGTDVTWDADGVGGASPVVIGSASAATVAGGAPLAVSLNAAATDAAVQALVRAIAFENGSDAPATASRTVTVTLTDSYGATSAAARDITVASVNDSPTDVTLAGDTVPENQPAGTAVGTLSTTDPDTAGTFTYSLVGGDGADDNSAFAIDGDTLATAASFNFEAKDSYTVRVRSADQGGLWTEKAFVLSVTNLNEAPTAVGLAGGTVAENQSAGTAVGTLSASDPDAGDTFTYSLVGGAGADDNGQFVIDGDTLKAAASFNFEAKNSYTIRVEAKDAGGRPKEKVFAVTVTDVAEAPTLDAGPTLVLPTVKTNSVKHGGTAVAALLANAADPETPNTLGVAVTGFTGIAGTWEHATSATGTWAPIGSATDAVPVDLFHGEFVRFKPAKNVTGYAGLRFRAWDGVLASAATEVAWVSVGVTTAFDLNGQVVTKSLNEDKIGTAVAAKALLGFLPTEFPAKTSLGLAVTAADGGGVWQTKVGKAWAPITGESEAAPHLLKPTDTVRFVPAADWNGAATLTYRAWNAAANTFSAEHLTAVAAVLPVDPPTIDISLPRVFSAAPQSVAALMLGSADPNDVGGAVAGIAITRAAAKVGQWEYRLTAGAGDWVKVAGVSPGKALLLDAHAEIRFTAAGPVAAALDYKAWDNSTAYHSGDRKPVSATAFSKLTETATFSLGNNAPTFKNGADPAFKGTTKKATILSVSSFLGRMTDTDKGFQKGVAVTGFTGAGAWDYSLDAGKTWQAVGDVSAAKLLLRSTDKLRFTPTGPGAATIKFQAWDRTTGFAGDRLAGQNDSESLAELTATLTVT